MPRGNPWPKLAITIDPEIHRRVRAAVARSGVSVSAWMADAARFHLLRDAGLAAVAQWENEHGHFTEEEMAEARRRVEDQLHSPGTGQRNAARVNGKSV